MSSVRFSRVIFAALAILLVLALPVRANATMVRLTTTVGAIDIVLYDGAAPQTVANFLAYVNSGAYRDTFVHRSVPGFVVQGGGFTWDEATNKAVAVPAKPPVANEFSASRSNRRGTIAMAKLGSNPNSATSQWFINLADNSASLDQVNGGFTVFGEVSAGSMAVVDAIAALPLVNAGSPFDAVPILGTIANGALRKSNLVFVTAATAVPASYQGLWWNAPAESESGWGINFAHQGDVIFATWFTYDATGKALWLSMTANKTTDGVYAGTLYQTRGPAFSAMPFNPAAVTVTAVGSGTLTFSDANHGSFAYVVNGIGQTKAITRQVFGPLPVCIFGAQPDLALATNYQDLWYAAPAESEAGWGVNFTHQGDVIFATWFTYDVDGTPLWLSATVNKTGTGVYAGTLNRTTGPAFNAVPFLPANVHLTAVGPVTLTFANGNSATFAYTVNGVTQSKAITRQVFRTPGTVCQ